MHPSNFIVRAVVALSLILGTISAFESLHLHKSMMAAEMRRDAALASLSSARADKRFVDNALRDGASGNIVGPLVLSVARFLATERSESIGGGVNVNMIGASRGVLSENREIKTIAEPVANVPGVMKVRISLRGTFATLAGFRAWIKSIRSLPAAISKLNVHDNVFNLTVDVYGKE